MKKILALLFLLNISCSVQQNKISSNIQNMPRFPGCESMNGGNKEKDQCAQQKMLEYVYANLQYPIKAKEEKIEGNCLIQFTVNNKGLLENIILARDIGNGCGEEALRVVTSMNDMQERWTPAVQNGKVVSVKYVLPVKFKLP